MTNKIEQLMGNVAEPIFDSIEFKNVIEDNLTWLIDHPNTVVRQVSAHSIEVYTADWLGLLTAMSIPANLHYTVIRMNGGMSYTDLPYSLRSIRVPSLTVVQNFIMTITSKSKIK